MYTIAIVEDDAYIAHELSELLRRQAYTTYVVRDFSRTLEELERVCADLILLDLNLPFVDGHALCREIRRMSNVPIIVVTSRNSQFDEMQLLSSGADDFVAKPYNSQTLIARIEAVLRRSGMHSQAPTCLEHNGVTLDPSSCTLSCDGKTVDLTKNELKILHLLMSYPGQVISRSKIQEHLWQTDEFVDDNTLTKNISHVRNTLSQLGKDEFIVTRRGLGYMVV